MGEIQSIFVQTDKCKENVKQAGYKDSRNDLIANIENIRIYVRGHNLYDIFYGRFKANENDVLSRYIELAPRKIFADILDKIDGFVYFDSRRR